MRKPSWNDTENGALIALYFTMRVKVDEGANYNKAAMIRFAQGSDDPADMISFDSSNEYIWDTLGERSRGSIEAKLMNVTAVLEDLGRQDISMAEHGYRPLSNYQSDLRAMVVGLAAVRDEAVAGGFKVQA